METKSAAAGSKDPKDEVHVLRERLEAVQDISKALATALPLDLLLNVVMDKITRLMNAERSTLFLLNPDTGVLTSKVALTNSTEPLHIRLELGEGVAGWVAMTGETVNVGDSYTDERFSPQVDYGTGFVTNSMLCMPLWNLQGATMGVIQVLNKRDGRFSAEDEALLDSLASQAAMSIENASMYDSLRERNRELLAAKRKLTKKMRDRETLLSIEQVTSGTAGLNSQFDEILELMLHTIPSEAGSILLRDRDSDRLTFRSTVGPSGTSSSPLSLPPGTGIVGWCAGNGEAVLSNDVENDPRHASEIASDLGVRVTSTICAPIHTETGPVGAIQLINCQRKEEAFVAEHLQLLTLVAGQLSRALVNSRAREEQINENRMAAIGQALSGVLHDLRTPMTVISGYVQLMVGEESRAERDENGTVIRQQITRMNDMVRELLAFARGDVTLLLQKHALTDFVESMRTTLEHEAASASIRLVLETRDRGMATFDSAKLSRCIQNLVRNAKDALQQTEHPEIIIRVDGDTNSWSIVVQDNGPGIPPEVQDTLFEEFVTFGKANGTGLGLSIVSKMVQEHGGTIELQSKPGEGACFVLRFPRSGRGPEEQE